ncbi:MAG: UDP-N-acetylmuramoyl-tripeptide--D-alanyl-D-alanine ligase [Bacillus sp. (in: Bacteria)]|nr:UDP-N-acetylmuramoyl-tripeptide--D-alanyl-D-alanine ligase [Bacillus sp. (in: firmicutes)]
MKPLYLQEIVNVIDGNVTHGSGNPLIEHVTYRPKKIKDHTLLFYRYNDMKIDKQLFKKYQPVTVVTDEPDAFRKVKNHCILIQVEHIEDAYWKFVTYYRNLFDIPIIGITGTCGKTTTKQMVKHILRKYYHVHSTYLSNNQRSLNLKYLLGIDDQTEAAVFEMPVASPGYLANTIQYFQPPIRVLLNIDVYHLKDCKTPDAYMKAKAEILTGLDKKTGIIILNGDDPNIKKVVDISDFNHVIYFGMSEGCHFKANHVRYTDEGMKFTLTHQENEYEVLVPGYGKSNVYNALASIAAASSAGIEIAECCERLATFEHMKEHLEIQKGVGGVTIIDDTWNVTPLSMAEALEVLKDISGTKIKIAILGYMPQLGNQKYAMEQYARMGEKVVNTNVDHLIIVGDEAKEIGRVAMQQGMNTNNVHFCTDGKDVYETVKSFLHSDAVILLKLPHRVMVEDTFKQFKRAIIR